jgi:hypothetical protein
VYTGTYNSARMCLEHLCVPTVGPTESGTPTLARDRLTHPSNGLGHIRVLAPEAPGRRYARAVVNPVEREGERQIRLAQPRRRTVDRCGHGLTWICITAIHREKSASYAHGHGPQNASNRAGRA